MQSVAAARNYRRSKCDTNVHVDHGAGIFRMSGAHGERQLTDPHATIFAPTQIDTKPHCHVRRKTIHTQTHTLLVLRNNNAERCRRQTRTTVYCTQSPWCVRPPRYSSDYNLFAAANALSLFSERQLTISFKPN